VSDKNKIPRTLFATSLALIAFAANSILCRLALDGQSIDAASFAIIRLSSGAVALAVICKTVGGNQHSSSEGKWPAALMLFLYAACFSFAYITLDTGTGALILFAAVQLTMIGVAVATGDRPHFMEWVGLLIAFSGFVYLVYPSVTTPSFAGFILMTVAGMSWGAYTILGKGSRNPLADTSRNFRFTLPFLIVLAVFAVQEAHVSPEGILWAVLSGALASGVGYTIWYMALAGLSTTQAATVQLMVPVLAAMGGWIFIGEAVSLRLAFSAAAILGGILLLVLGRRYSLRFKQVG
jgi:drug/metabolite transporter (DMT)-like permease